MRGGEIIGRALAQAWLGNRYASAGDVLKELAAEGWHLVRVTHTVGQEPNRPWGEHELHNLKVDIEDDRIFDIDRVIHRQLIERSARDPQELIAHVKRDMVINLAVGIATEKGLFNADPR